MINKFQLAVQNERQPRNTAQVKPDSLIAFIKDGATVSVMHSNLSNAVDQTVGTTTSDCSERGSCMSSISSNGSSTSLLAEDNEDLKINKRSNKNGHSNSKNSKKQKFNNLNDDSSNSSTNDKLVNDLSNSNANIQPMFNINSNDSVFEITARILLMSIKWCKSLQSFNSLVYRDQVKKILLIFF
jgi:hypothetical protein